MLRQCRSISVPLQVRETSYLSFRPPELGQPFWSFLLLVVSVQELKCLIPKFKLARNLTLPNSQNPSRGIQRGPSLIARYELALTGLVTNPTADRRTWRGEGSCLNGTRTKRGASSSLRATRPVSSVLLT